MPNLTAAHYWFVFLFVEGYLITLLLIPTVLLTKKRQPVSTVAWLMAIIAMPYFGALLFLLFGINHVAARVIVQRRNLQESVLRASYESSHTDLLLLEHQEALAEVASKTSGWPVTSGNSVEMFTVGDAAFAAIEKALSEATETIHLEYYIWQPDLTGTRLRDLLIERAKHGVKVRFLYDHFGSSRLTRRFLDPMRDAGIAVSPFVPGKKFLDRWSINLRSHRKIVIVDGNVGFTGGMNVGDEYLGKDPYFGYWRDTHVRVEGPVVGQLQEVFAQDWLCATGVSLDLTTSSQPSPGQILGQVIAGGPEQTESPFHSIMFGAIVTSRKTVTLATSYFVPTPSLESALISAAQRGVDVRIMLSGPKTYWHTLHAARSYYDELLAAGCNIFEYQRGQFHTKALSIDGEWMMIGTPNFDARSVFLNFEVAIAFFDQELAGRINEQFDGDIHDSHKILLEEWCRRSTWNRLKENYSRMFSPVL